MSSGATHRTRAWSALTLSAAFVFASLVVSSAPAGAVTALSVTPSTGLLGGQPLTLAGSGYAAGTLGVCQGLPATSGIDSCGFGATTVTTADANGEFSLGRSVERFIYVPSLGRWVDCADASEGCVFAAADTSDIAGTLATAPITFAAAPAPPAVRGSVVVDPDSLTAPGTVGVTGTGFRSSAIMNVFQCAPGATDQSGCAIAKVRNFTADASGQFSASLTFDRTITPPGGAPIDCQVSNPAQRCHIIAAEAVDFAGTFVATPVTLEPPLQILPGVNEVEEGDTGTVLLQVPVSLSRAITDTVTVEWNTLFVSGAHGAQADPATDYTPTGGTVTFLPGATSAAVPITVDGDQLDEPDEYILVSFHDSTNAPIGGFYGLGVGVIANDDDIVVLPGVGSAVEGDAATATLEVPVQLSKASADTVTVQWNTLLANSQGAQADPATDYNPTGGTVTFLAGQTSATVPITVHGDQLAEPDEYIIVSFHDPTNARLGGFYGLGVGFITNDD